MNIQVLMPHNAAPSPRTRQMVNEIARWKEGKPLLYETDPGTVSRMTQTG